MTDSKNSSSHNNNSASSAVNSTANTAANEDAIIKKMRVLIEALKTHNNAYYVLDNPILEDSEYDQFSLSLLELEEQ